jgi:hypothetical protein
VAFGNYLSVICGNLCPNAAPLQEVADTFQTSSEMRSSLCALFAIHLSIHIYRSIDRHSSKECLAEYFQSPLHSSLSCLLFN